MPTLTNPPQNKKKAWWAEADLPLDKVAALDAEFERTHQQVIWYVIRRKQCEVIGKEYLGDAFFRKEGWWREFGWTKDQERVFRGFLEGYFRECPAARPLFGIVNKRPRNAQYEAAVEYYCKNYGWRQV